MLTVNPLAFVLSRIYLSHRLLVITLDVRHLPSGEPKHNRQNRLQQQYSRNVFATWNRPKSLEVLTLEKPSKIHRAAYSE
jgi:hypothetical protein